MLPVWDAGARSGARDNDRIGALVHQPPTVEAVGVGVNESFRSLTPTPLNLPAHELSRGDVRAFVTVLSPTRVGVEFVPNRHHGRPIQHLVDAVDRVGDQVASPVGIGFRPEHGRHLFARRRMRAPDRENGEQCHASTLHCSALDRRSIRFENCPAKELEPVYGSWGTIWRRRGEQEARVHRHYNPTLEPPASARGRRARGRRRPPSHPLYIKETSYVDHTNTSLLGASGSPPCSRFRGAQNPRILRVPPATSVAPSHLQGL